MMAYTYYRGSTPNSKIFIICFYTSKVAYINYTAKYQFFLSWGFIYDIAFINVNVKHHY